MPTIRIEVQFPQAINVEAIEAVPGWQVATQKDATGRIVNAVWQGGRIAPGDFLEFGVVATNPRRGQDLSWPAIQTYADQSEVQWNGLPDSQQPAAVTRVTSPGSGPNIAMLLAASAVMLSVAALGLGFVTWRQLANLKLP